MTALIVVRHGQAQSEAHDAPLTARGLREAEALADAIAALSVRDPCLITSGYRRANETAAPIARRLGLRGPESEFPLLYSGEMAGLISFASFVGMYPARTVIAVAHLPFVNAHADGVAAAWGCESLELDRSEYGAGFSYDLTAHTYRRLPR